MFVRSLGRTDGKFTPLFYRTSSPLGLLPKNDDHKAKSASREHGAPGSAGEMAPWAPLTLRNDYAKAVAGMTYNKAYHI